MSTLPDLLRSHASFLLTGHENPDGDCVGAQVAMARLLQQLGKTATIVNPDPLSRSFEFLAEHTQFHCGRGAAELYDVERDVGETADLVAQRPAEVLRLRALLRRHLDACGAQFPARRGGRAVARP